MIRLRTTLFPTALAAVALLSLAAIGQPPQDKPKLGFKDTPMLPGGKWHVHDGDRPQPPIVTPGQMPGQPPSDAVVLFDGKDLAKWHVNGGEPGWKLEDGAMVVPPSGAKGSGTITSKEEFGDCQIHVEFATPNPPRGSDQGRGNSGVLIMGRYEIQVLDNFDNLTYPDGQASAVYGQNPPQVNASKKAGEWQTYDIIFTAPRFAASGSVESPAYVTVLHNGVLTQDHFAILGPMTYRALAKYSPHGPKGPLAFQDHGNPVRYRNIWVRELKPVDAGAKTAVQAEPAPAPGTRVESPAANGSISFQLSGTTAKAQPAAGPRLDFKVEVTLPVNALNAEIPKGEVTRYTFASSKIFPGTTRDYWVYVPKQYDPAKPACVHVHQDGIPFGNTRGPAMFDELIARGDIPVTIGVFVTPGVVKATSPGAQDRFNRSFEYDGLGDAYARFLLEELLPEVETKTTGDGRAIKLSKDGNDRSIGGASSGAIAAFTAAWERPDAFRRVFSSIGTYVGLRGGNVYPTLVRKYEPKPIRVFLQDGSKDLNIYGGDWWMANQEMERALTFAGYEVEHAWGEGGHNGNDAAPFFADAMRFLWKGWPEAPKTGAGSEKLKDILIPGEGWQLVGEGYQFTEGPAVNAKGEVFFNDIPTSKTYKVGPDGSVSEFVSDTKRANGAHFGPDGKFYMVATGTQQVLVYDAEMKPTVVADGIPGNDLVVRFDGGIYVTQPERNQPNASKVWYLAPNGEKKVVDTGLNFANGVTLSPDQSLLYVTDMRSHWIYSYVVQPDGSLANKQKFFHLHTPDNADFAGADGIRADASGRLFVATAMGVQVCDPPGRVNAIIPTPNGKSSNVVLGGEKFDTLYVTAGEKVFKRKLKVKGANAFQSPVKPPRPQL